MQEDKKKEFSPLNSQVVQLQKIAKLHQLKWIIEEPIHPGDFVISITNLRYKTMNIVALKIFLEEQCPKDQNHLSWVSDVVSLPLPTNPKELKALQKVSSCPKGLLQTAGGLTLTNLFRVKKGSYVTNYSGELVIRYQNLKQPSVYRLLDLGTLPTTSQRYLQQIKTIEGEDGSYRIDIFISAQFYRGWGSYMAHLYTPQELAELYFVPKNHSVVTETVEPEYFSHRIFYKALEELAPFTLLGYSYGLQYWFNEQEDPILFDKDGFQIKQKLPIRNYIVRVYNPINSDFTEIKGSLKEISKRIKNDQNATDGIVYKKNHFQHLYNRKNKRYELPRIFNEVRTGKIPAEDYYNVGTSLLNILQAPLAAISFTSQKRLTELNNVIKMYKAAIALFLEDKPPDYQAQISLCSASVKLAKAAIKQLPRAESKSAQVDLSRQINIPAPPPTQIATLPPTTAADAIAQRNLMLLSRLITLQQLNAQDSTGQTLLHKAVLQGELNICAYLLIAKANPQVLDHRQRTPLDYAKNSHFLIWKMLDQTNNTLYNDQNFQSAISSRG